MTYVIVAALFVGFLVLISYLAIMAFEQDSLANPYSFSGLALAIGFIALMLYAGDEADKQGPCLRYETSMYYNSATKTMMPARRCVERAEWVKP
jgi:hypothetical protein